MLQSQSNNDTQSALSKNGNESSPEMDAARKIWTEMRRTSRGGRHREARGSISTANYGKKNGGTISGLGLGVARSSWWDSPWW
jgi:hypothetical protein